MTARCQSGTAQTNCAQFPWADDSRAYKKSNLLKYACDNASDIRPSVAARAVIDPDADAAVASIQPARRFFENHPDLFKIDKRGGVVWIEPRPATFTLTANNQSAKTHDCVEFVVDNPKHNAK